MAVGDRTPRAWAAGGPFHVSPLRFGPAVVRKDMGQRCDDVPLELRVPMSKLRLVQGGMAETRLGEQILRRGPEAAMARLEAAAWHGRPSMSVVGLDHAGVVSAACFAHLGFRVVGVDVCAEKVAHVAAGRSPVAEDRVDTFLSAGVGCGLVRATQNLVAAVLETDITFICLGLETQPDGSCDLGPLLRAARAIGQALSMKSSYHVIVLRCRLPPGTTLGVVACEIQRASGRMLGPDFGVGFSPVLMREGTAVADFFDPRKIVVGAFDQHVRTMVGSIFASIDAKLVVTTIEAAEMVRLVDSAWRATKVAFGNEVGRLCKALDIDSHDVMEILADDPQCDLPCADLKPGFALGGSLQSEDVRAVGRLAHEHGVSVPMIDALPVSNARHVDHALRLLEPFRDLRLGFLGLTFEPGVRDLAGSPVLDLMAALQARDVAMKAYDGGLPAGTDLERHTDQVRRAVPRQSRLIDILDHLLTDDADELLGWADVLVVCHATSETRGLVDRRKNGCHVLDLGRLHKVLPAGSAYQGIAW